MATSPKPKGASSGPRGAGGRRKKATAGKRRSTAGRASAASHDASSTVNDFDRLRDDLVRLTTSVSALMAGQAGGVRDLVTETASDYYETGLEYARDAEAQMRGMAGDLSKQIERNPLAAVGIVFGVGYIIGLMRRR